MSLIYNKIECCAELAEGKTAEQKAKDFKKKVKQVTKLTESGFNECNTCSTAYDMFLRGETLKSILNACF